MVELTDEIKAYDDNEISVASGRLLPEKKGKFSSIFGTDSSLTSSSTLGCSSVSNWVKQELDMYFQHPSLNTNDSPLEQ